MIMSVQKKKKKKKRRSRTSIDRVDFSIGTMDRGQKKKSLSWQGLRNKTEKINHRWRCVDVFVHIWNLENWSIELKGSRSSRQRWQLSIFIDILKVMITVLSADTADQSFVSFSLSVDILLTQLRWSTYAIKLNFNHRLFLWSTERVWAIINLLHKRPRRTNCLKENDRWRCFSEQKKKKVVARKTSDSLLKYLVL